MDRILELGDESPVAGLSIADFSRQFRSRNEDILTEEEQAVVDATKVLVAGCGTVAGSAVEPLVRLGINDLVLADPDVYDVTNLNRQACLLADVGRPKPEVLADRAAAINPLVQTEVLTEGITPENVEAAFKGITFVCEGVDASMDLWAKYLVHHHAALRRIPVVSGVDFGGKPTLYVFDYRSDPRPFYGKGTEADHREGRTIDAIRWIGNLTIPADFAPIIVDRLQTGAPWPQTVYTAWGIGALMTRTLVDLALHRDVPYIVAVDFHQIARKRRKRLQERLRLPKVLLQARREANRVQREGEVITPSPDRATSLPGGVSPHLLPFVDAIRHAPSAGNQQPWSVHGEGSTLRLYASEDAQLLGLDPTGALMAQSLGCAIEATNSIAEMSIEYAGNLGAVQPSSLVATLQLERFRSDYSTQAGLLSLRHTNRRPYERDEPPVELLEELRDAGREHGVSVSVFTSPADFDTLGKIAAESQLRQLRECRAAGEFGRVLRSTSAVAESGTGIPPDALLPNQRLSKVALRVLAWLPGAREHLLTRHSHRLVARSGALLVLGWGESVQDQIASGRALMSLWLKANRGHWAIHPVSVREPTQSEITVRDGTTVSLPSTGFTLVRLGRAARCSPGQRMSIEEIVR